MKNTDRIVDLLRANPGADISSLVDEDASTLTSKVVATTHIPIVRQLIIQFVHTVHLASAQVLRREKQRRVAAELDAAQSRAHLHAANRRLRRSAEVVGLLDILTGSWSAEQEELLDELKKSLREVRGAGSRDGA